jgi:hypothetical protein
MTKDQLESVLDRVRHWPPERQVELAELALEIDAELAGVAYRATHDELRAIDEGLAGTPASDEDVRRAFAAFRRK